MKVLLFGASGMVGQGVLRECLLDSDLKIRGGASICLLVNSHQLTDQLIFNRVQRRPVFSHLTPKPSSAALLRRIAPAGSLSELGPASAEIARRHKANVLAFCLELSQAQREVRLALAYYELFEDEVIEASCCRGR